MSGRVTRCTSFARSQRKSGVAGRIDKPAERDRAALCPNCEENKPASMGISSGSASNGEYSDDGEDGVEGEDAPDRKEGPWSMLGKGIALLITANACVGLLPDLWRSGMST